MKMKTLILLTVLFFAACHETGGGVVGTVSLNIRYAQSFDPNAVPGEVVEYRVAITDSKTDVVINKVFSAGTTSATFDGFAGGTELDILLEYVNANGLVVRRGRAHGVVIQSGTNTEAEVLVNNVPIFTNVRDGATVVNGRFVPRVFAPGNIAFELSDSFAGSVSVLPDAISGETSFSLGSDDAPGEAVYSVLPVHIPPLTPGEHELTVLDPDTGESSKIAINVVERSSKNALTTTAGGLVGVPLGNGEAKVFNLARYFNILSQNN